MPVADTRKSEQAGLCEDSNEPKHKKSNAGGGESDRLLLGTAGGASKQAGDCNERKLPIEPSARISNRNPKQARLPTEKAGPKQHKLLVGSGNSGKARSKGNVNASNRPGPSNGTKNSVQPGDRTEGDASKLPQSKANSGQPTETPKTKGTTSGLAKL